MKKFLMINAKAREIANHFGMKDEDRTSFIQGFVEINLKF